MVRFVGHLSTDSNIGKGQWYENIQKFRADLLKCIDLGLFKLIQTVLFLYEKYSLEPYRTTLFGRRKCD